MNKLKTYPYILAVRQSSKLTNIKTIQDLLNSNTHYPIHFDPDGYYYEHSEEIRGLNHFCEPNELNKNSQ